MKNFLQVYTKNSMVISVLLIILSLFFIFKPNASLNVIMIIIGVILAISGIILVTSYFSTSKDIKLFSYELTTGIIALIFGAVFIFKPSIINDFLSIIIGSWIIVKSITSIQLLLNMRNSTNHWFIFFILSLLTLIIGIIMLFNPFATSFLVTACGIILFVSEMINIAENLMIVRSIK